MHINPATSRTPGAARARRGAGVAVAALACALLVSACGSSSSSSSSTATTTVDTARVAASIQQSVLTERHLRVTVVCPSTVPQEKGKTFICIATGHSAKNPAVVTKTPFKVTVQTDKGYTTYIGE
jgi:7-keto-8-aminopelargonate synthetase-like enzyme